VEAGSVHSTIFEYLITDDRGHGDRSGRANGASDRRHRRSRLEASASRTAATALCKVVKVWIAWFSLVMYLRSHDKNSIKHASQNIAKMRQSSVDDG